MTNVISLQEYFNGDYPAEFDSPLIASAEELLSRVGRLLDAIGWEERVVVNSGYRTPEHNKEIGGARHSYHSEGRAIDLRDPNGELYREILNHVSLLKSFGLWLEYGEKTKGWVHLDTGSREDRDPRIFRP